MNVHQAKGLEAPVVFLADPAGNAKGKATTHVLRPEGSGERAAGDVSSPEGATNGEAGKIVSGSDEDPEDSSDYLVAPVTEEGAYHTKITHAPLGWDTAREPTFAEIESAHENAEAHRLLYVAATRAKNLLVVSRPSKKDGTPAVKDPWGDLAEKIGEEVPVLDPPPVEQDDPAPFSAPDSDRLDERDRSIARQSRPSFREQSVTEVVHGASNDESLAPAEATREEADPFHPVGYGRFFGTVVHNALEQWVRRSRAAGSPAEIPPAEDLAARLQQAREEDAVRNEASAEARSSSLSDDDLAAEARSTIDRFASGPLAETVRDADVVYAEYPFALRTGSTDRPADTSGSENEKPEAAPADSGGTETAPETVLRGTIDLVYRDDDGWHIVDYKTDRIQDVGALSELPSQHPYRKQIRRYARFWRRLTEEPAATASLWFTDRGTRVPVDGSAIDG
jgi:ATP-dependent helicase/nuclease subunit A